MKRILRSILPAIFIIVAPTPVFAFPFYANPQSFQNFLNTRKWTDGSKAYFQNLNNCGIQNRGTTYDLLYVCFGGFVTIRDPRGTQICSLSEAKFWRNQSTFNFYPNSCRYK